MKGSVAMENHVPTKGITAGQISKIYDILVAALQKSGLPSEPTQHVLEQQGVALADEFVASVRKRVEVLNGIIVRKVKVNRDRSPQEAIDATGRKQYTNQKVVDAMPKSEGAEVEVCFFKPESGEYTRSGFMSDKDLEKAFERRNLKIDPLAVIAANEANPALADEMPHGTQWKDAGGNWCCVAFRRWSGERFVSVDRSDYGWYGDWSFGGVCK